MRGDRIAQLLDVLQAGEFIYEQPAMGGLEYRFKHALTRDEAYKSLLTERRKVLHERTALGIEAVTPGGWKTTTQTSPIIIVLAITPPRRSSTCCWQANKRWKGVRTRKAARTLSWL